MEFNEKMETTIATRELLFKKDDGTEEVVSVSIDKPAKTNNDEEWCCTYEIVSSNHKRTHQTLV